MRKLLLLALFLGSLPLGAQVTVTGSTIISGSGVACPGCALTNVANIFTQTNTFPALSVPGGINGLQVYENTGLFNIGIGVSTVGPSVTGSQNFGVGDQSLQNLTSGYGDVAIGVGALNALTTGFEDGCFGDECGVSMTTGYKNWGDGAAALASLTSGSENTGVGVGACSDIQGGSNNTCLGYLTLSTNGAGTFPNVNNGIYVGWEAEPSANGNTNEIVIGYNQAGHGSNTSTLGDSATTNSYLYGIPTLLSLAGSGTGCVGINNTGLTSVVSCGGGGGGSTIEVNGAGLISSATANFINSAATDGLTLTFTNPSAGNIQLGFTGTLTNAGLTNSAITIGGTSVSLGGSTSSFPSPGAIGGTTPSTGAFTTLSATTSVTDGGLTPGDCVQASTGGLLVTTGAACGTGGGSGPTVQTGGVNNISQVLLNFTNTGSIGFTNPSGGVESAALISPGASELLWFNGSNAYAGLTLGTGLSVSGGALNVSSVTGSGTATYLPLWTSGTAQGNSHITDNGSQITSSEPIAVSSSLPGELVLTAGTGSLPALGSNEVAYMGPATGGTSYARQPVNTASSTGGVELWGAPTTINGQNAIQSTWFHPEATIGSGVGTFGATPLYTVIATTVANNNGHFTNLSVSTLTAGSGCTTPPVFAVFANNNSNPSSYYVTASTSETYQTSPVTVAQALAFTAGQNIGIVMEGAGSGCTTAQFVAGATYVEP